MREEQSGGKWSSRAGEGWTLPLAVASWLSCRASRGTGSSYSPLSPTNALKSFPGHLCSSEAVEASWSIRPPPAQCSRSPTSLPSPCPSFPSLCHHESEPMRREGAITVDPPARTFLPAMRIPSRKGLSNGRVTQLTQLRNRRPYVRACRPKDQSASIAQDARGSFHVRSLHVPRSPSP